MEKIRCSWVNDDKIYQKYHDNEWGVESHDDKYLFEMLVLESFQAGLSWLTILKKRDNFRQAFDDFDYNRIAKYNEKKLLELLEDKNIIRNKLKINATINNAKIFIEVQKEYKTFDNYIWSFVGNKQIVSSYKHSKDVPAYNDLSTKISLDLKKRGFKFVGTTIIYSYLQAIGILNDHTIECFRYKGNKF